MPWLRRRASGIGSARRRRGTGRTSHGAPAPIAPTEKTTPLPAAGRAAIDTQAATRPLTPEGGAKDDTPRGSPRDRDAQGRGVPELTGLLAPPQLPDEIGRLGPYRVLRVLGTGGMGVVFEAEDRQLKRRV